METFWNGYTEELATTDFWASVTGAEKERIMEAQERVKKQYASSADCMKLKVTLQKLENELSERKAKLANVDGCKSDCRRVNGRNVSVLEEQKTRLMNAYVSSSCDAKLAALEQNAFMEAQKKALQDIEEELGAAEGTKTNIVYIVGGLILLVGAYFIFKKN
jgi:molybdopterin converting factor small subunit